MLPYINDLVREAHLSASTADEVYIVPEIISQLKFCLSQADLVSDLHTPHRYVYLRRSPELDAWFDSEVYPKITEVYRLLESEPRTSSPCQYTRVELPSSADAHGACLGGHFALVSLVGRYTDMAIYEATRANQSDRRDDFWNTYCCDCTLRYAYEESFDSFVSDYLEDHDWTDVFDPDAVRNRLPSECFEDDEGEAIDVDDDELEQLWNDHGHSSYPMFAVFDNVRDLYDERETCCSMADTWLSLDDCPHGHEPDDDEESVLTDITIPPHLYGYGSDWTDIRPGHENSRSVSIYSHTVQHDVLGRPILYVRPLCFKNVYSSGRICYGDTRHSSFEEAIRVFWTARFNDDLNSSDLGYLVRGKAGANQLRMLSADSESYPLALYTQSTESIPAHNYIPLGHSLGKTLLAEYRAPSLVLFPPDTVAVESYALPFHYGYPILRTCHE